MRFMTRCPQSGHRAIHAPEGSGFRGVSFEPQVLQSSRSACSDMLHCRVLSRATLRAAGGIAREGRRYSADPLRRLRAGPNVLKEARVYEHPPGAAELSAIVHATAGGAASLEVDHESINQAVAASLNLIRIAKRLKTEHHSG